MDKVNVYLVVSHSNHKTVANIIPLSAKSVSQDQCSNKKNALCLDYSFMRAILALINLPLEIK